MEFQNNISRDAYMFFIEVILGENRGIMLTQLEAKYNMNRNISRKTQMIRHLVRHFGIYTLSFDRRLYFDKCSSSELGLNLPPANAEYVTVQLLDSRKQQQELKQQQRHIMFNKYIDSIRNIVPDGTHLPDVFLDVPQEIISIPRIKISNIKNNQDLHEEDTTLDENNNQTMDESTPSSMNLEMLVPEFTGSFVVTSDKHSEASIDLDTLLRELASDNDEEENADSLMNLDYVEKGPRYFIESENVPYEFTIDGKLYLVVDFINVNCRQYNVDDISCDDIQEIYESFEFLIEQDEKISKGFRFIFRHFKTNDFDDKWKIYLDLYNGESNVNSSISVDDKLELLME
jgi:hypothetical protein